MIIQEFTLDKYDWFVRVYYLIDKFPKEDIFGNLMELGCDKDEAFETVNSLEEEGFNVGMENNNFIIFLKMPLRNDLCETVNSFGGPASKNYLFRMFRPNEIR